MNSVIQYVLESTLCLLISYLMFRVLMRKEPLFMLNRGFLLSLVLLSSLIPLVQLPGFLFAPEINNPVSPLLGERNQVFTAPHLVFYPGFMIMLTVLAFNLIGDGLRDALDPRLAHSSS